MMQTTYLFRCPRAAEWHGASDPVVEREAPSSVMALRIVELCPVCNTKMYPIRKETTPAAA